MSNEAKLRHNALSAVCDDHFSLVRCVSGLSRSLRTGLSPCERELCSPFSFLFCFRSASENLRQREEQASTYIQSRWRSYNTRNNFERLKTAVLSIQAGYRGHLGRKRALCRSHLVSSSSQLFSTRKMFIGPTSPDLIFPCVQVASDSRLQHFQRAALILQRYWRGHFSRKKVHSFYDRSRYLQSVHSVGERLRENLYAQHGSLRRATWKGKVIIRR